MNRRTDVSFIIGLCMVSMLAFSSSLLLQGANGAHLKKDLGTQWARVSQAANGWMQDLQATPAQSKRAAPIHTAQIVPKQSVQATAVSGDTTGATTPATKWSKADIARLSEIADALMTSMTQQDWTEAATAIATDKPAAAEGTLAELLVTNLKPADLTWLEQHFTGSAAFGLNDVVLLQKTLTEAEAELTPQELSLVKQGVAQYMQSQTKAIQ